MVNKITTPELTHKKMADNASAYFGDVLKDKLTILNFSGYTAIEDAMANTKTKNVNKIKVLLAVKNRTKIKETIQQENSANNIGWIH